MRLKAAAVASNWARLFSRHGLQRVEPLSPARSGSRARRCWSTAWIESGWPFSAEQHLPARPSKKELPDALAPRRGRPCGGASAPPCRGLLHVEPVTRGPRQSRARARRAARRRARMDRRCRWAPCPGPKRPVEEGRDGRPWPSQGRRLFARRASRSSAPPRAGSARKDGVRRRGGATPFLQRVRRDPWFPAARGNSPTIPVVRSALPQPPRPSASSPRLAAARWRSAARRPPGSRQGRWHALKLAPQFPQERAACPASPALDASGTLRSSSKKETSRRRSPRPAAPARIPLRLTPGSRTFGVRDCDEGREQLALVGLGRRKYFWLPRASPRPAPPEGAARTPSRNTPATAKGSSTRPVTVSPQPPGRASGRRPPRPAPGAPRDLLRDGACCAPPPVGQHVQLAPRSGGYSGRPGRGISCGAANRWPLVFSARWSRLRNFTESGLPSSVAATPVARAGGESVGLKPGPSASTS